MPPSPGDLLDSWKEIAVYLNRSVRTVRRWERDEGLPVHRHLHRSLASVYADKVEIDAWKTEVRSRPSRETAAASVGAASGLRKSIAILPFLNLSPDPENEFFADGLTDEVTAALSSLGALRVISRTSSMTFRGTTKDLKTIASELGVRYVLEGSVRRAGERLRTTAQLIDAGTDAHLWAETFDGTVGDVFAIQERIARVIVEALRLRLTPDEDQRLATRVIDDVRAYECYLRARHESWRWRRESIDHAVQLLRHGLEIIGDNALLYAALGLTYLQYRDAGLDLSERPLIEAGICEQKVSALEARSAAGLRLRGWLHYAHGRIQEAVRDLKAALDIDGNNADSMLLLCNCYLISGRVSFARQFIARLMAVDPLTPLTRCFPAFADVMEGNFAQSVGPYRQMFEMDPSNPMARLFYIWILILNQREVEAGVILEGFAPEMRETLPARIAFFLVYAMAGEREKAEAVLTPEIEDVATASDVFPRFLAQGFALAGLPAKAIHWLEIAVARGFVNYPFLTRHDPAFVSLRLDPRFERLMETVRVRWEMFEA